LPGEVTVAGLGGNKGVAFGLGLFPKPWEGNCRTGIGMPLPDRIGWIDAAVMLLVLGSAVVVGLWTSRKNRNAESFFLGDRSLPWWAILGSIVATETSAATVMSVPGKAFGLTGMKFLQLAIGLCVGKMLVAWILMPLFFDGRLMSAYEVLRRRFGERTRVAAALLFLMARNIGDGLRLFLAAIVLQELLGWHYIVCVIVIGAVTIAYTFFGGMRSVVWNDCIQLLVYVAGGIGAVFVIAGLLPGGWSQWWSFAESSGRLQIFDFRFSISDPWNFWAGLVGGAFLSLGTHGTDQMMVQRYLSARSSRDASRAVVWSGVVVAAQFALFLFVGVGLAGYYDRVGGDGGNPDRVFVTFVVNEFPRGAGLIGMILAAILAATMSTLSSSLNSSASSLINDFWLPRQKQTPSERQQLAMSRWLSVGFGLLQILIGIWAVTWNQAVIDNALTIAGFAFGLLLGVFALGVLTRRVAENEALLGASSGLVVLLIVQFVLPVWEIRVAFVWLAMIGSVTTFMAGCLFAAALPGQVSGDGR